MRPWFRCERRGVGGLKNPRAMLRIAKGGNVNASWSSTTYSTGNSRMDTHPVNNPVEGWSLVDGCITNTKNGTIKFFHRRSKNSRFTEVNQNWDYINFLFHGCHVFLSRKALRYFFSPCRFASTLNFRTFFCTDNGKERHHKWKEICLVVKFS